MRKHPPLISLGALIVAIGACSTQPQRDTSPALGPTSVSNVSIVGTSPAGLSVTSTPAAGSSVKGPLSQVILDFSAPVALGEVLVSGPDGVMPMMLSPAGVQTHYSVPVPGLGEGFYTVAWKAILDGQPKNGSFAFTIK